MWVPTPKRDFRSRKSCFMSTCLATTTHKPLTTSNRWESTGLRDAAHRVGQNNSTKGKKVMHTTTGAFITRQRHVEQYTASPTTLFSASNVPIVSRNGIVYQGHDTSAEQHTRIYLGIVVVNNAQVKIQCDMAFCCPKNWSCSRVWIQELLDDFVDVDPVYAYRFCAVGRGNK